MTTDDAILKRIEELRKGCHDTYNGGHNEPDTHDAFHHGMNVGIDCLKALLLPILSQSEADGAKRERERVIQKLQANIWEVSSQFDIESKMHNGIIDHLIKEVRKI